MLRVQVAEIEHDWQMPGGEGPIRVVVDGAILEILSAGAAGADRLPSAEGSYPVAENGEVSWWML